MAKPVEVEFKSHISEMTPILQMKLYNFLEAVGMDASSRAAGKAPYKTGALRNSITYAVDQRNYDVYIGTNLDYAIYQELGTSKIKGKHFLQFGATAHADAYQRILENYLKS